MRWDAPGCWWKVSPAMVYAMESMSPAIGDGGGSEMVQATMAVWPGLSAHMQGEMVVVGACSG